MHVRFVDELSLALVSSTRARAKIVSVDFSAALAAPGVVDYVDYKDLPGNNMYGLIVPEIELLPQSEVGSFCYIPNSRRKNNDIFTKKCNPKLILRAVPWLVIQGDYSGRCLK